MKAEALRIEIREEPLDSLASYAEIPIAFTVTRTLDASLVERGAAASIIKDYDALEHPTSWKNRFDISNWGLLGAYSENVRVAGAVIAFRTPELEMLEGRDDLAVLWDIRVHPQMRGRGIGSALLDSVENWTRARGGTCLKVETQNVNVDACLFYARRGFKLGAVNRDAYPELPDEIQLLWYKELGRDHGLVEPQPATELPPQ
ncbi:MAG: GNAT family N-acetyltransferase [Gemmatimonadaceae bacterium]